MVPAYLNVVDIAGLVKGAAEGQGLGNDFLSHISACDAIFHLCRAFEDPDVTHVEGEVDPVRDLEIISEELRLKDEENLLKNLDKLEKVVARGGDKKLKPEYDSMLKIKDILIDQKRHLRFEDWNAHDVSTKTIHIRWVALTLIVIPYYLKKIGISIKYCIVNLFIENAFGFVFHSLLLLSSLFFCQQNSEICGFFRVTL